MSGTTVRTIILLAAALVTGGCARAHVESSARAVPAATPANADAIPAGTAMTVRLNKLLATNSSTIGDLFAATTTEPVASQNGQTVVPVGAIVHGHVAGLRTSTVLGEKALIRLDFDSLVFSGRRYPFNASVTSYTLAGRTRGSTRATMMAAAAGAAIGAAMGATIGGGGLGKIIAGSVLGGGTGTVISLGRGDVESLLSEGSTLTLRSTQTVTLR
jgi:hypothetical protein